jgi:hypothetical protein
MSAATTKTAGMTMKMRFFINRSPPDPIAGQGPRGGKGPRKSVEIMYQKKLDIGKH